MGNASTVIHCNPTLGHQVKIAEALRSGFLRHGINAHISNRAETKADCHVLMGPWFAFRQWQHHQNTLYIDRAYWGDPQSVSVHWLKGGEKVFTHNHNARAHPNPQPYKRGDRILVLCDYKHIPNAIGTIRLHPAEHKQTRSLKQDLDAHEIAIGRRTTALVDAAIHGLMVKTTDPHSPVRPISGCRSYVRRAEWLTNLAWHNWSLVEISTGAMLDALGTANKPDRIAG